MKSNPRQHTMLGRVLSGLISILLIFFCAFLVYVIAYVISSEVLPAVEQGGFNVETSTMILNRVWEGNEIYILLAGYTILCCASAWGGVRFARKAILPARHP